jgi:hypothetical protein
VRAEGKAEVWGIGAGCLGVWVGLDVAAGEFTR